MEKSILRRFFTGVVNGVTYYLLDNEYYFQRNGLYGFYDDAERFIFFSRAVLVAAEIHRL